MRDQFGEQETAPSVDNIYASPIPLRCFPAWFREDNDVSNDVSLRQRHIALTPLEVLSTQGIRIPV